MYIWRCEHARFCVEDFMRHINFHSFIMIRHNRVFSLLPTRAWFQCMLWFIYIFLLLVLHFIVLACVPQLHLYRVFCFQSLHCLPWRFWKEFSVPANTMADCKLFQWFLTLVLVVSKAMCIYWSVKTVLAKLVTVRVSSGSSMQLKLQTVSDCMTKTPT